MLFDIKCVTEDDLKFLYNSIGRGTAINLGCRLASLVLDSPNNCSYG